MNDQPKMGLNLERKTTQLNLWMVVGILVFMVVSGIFLVRFLHDPPDSTREMKQGFFHRSGVWARAVC